MPSQTWLRECWLEVDALYSSGAERKTPRGRPRLRGAGSAQAYAYMLELFPRLFRPPRQPSFLFLSHPRPLRRRRATMFHLIFGCGHPRIYPRATPSRELFSHAAGTPVREALWAHRTHIDRVRYLPSCWRAALCIAWAGISWEGLFRGTADFFRGVWCLVVGGDVPTYWRRTGGFADWLLI